MLHFAVLITCFNRRDTTTKAIAALQAANARGAAKITVVLHDDGSRDGTAQAVRERFPETIILTGDGTAFWNTGMYKAWKAAESLPVDAFIWLNDDVAVTPDAIDEVLTNWREAERRRPDGQFILAGATSEEGQDNAAAACVTYGGKARVRTPWALRFDDLGPNGQLQPIDTFNGNFVVIPKVVSDRIGLNDPTYFHNFGDIDYGLRAKTAGIDVWLMPKVIGSCPGNHTKTQRRFGNPDLTLRQQWKVVNTHFGSPFRSWARLTYSHSGIWFPLHFLLPYRYLVLPRWLLKVLAPQAKSRVS